MTDKLTSAEFRKQFGQKTSKKHEFLIGIDPDVDKSGVADYDPETKEISLMNLTFFEIYEYLESYNVPVKVFIEAGWLNKSNWHRIDTGTSSINAKIGQRTGANHEVGKKIAEMCEYLRIDYELVKPTRSKVNAEMFKKITKYTKRTNQEQRDAAMLVFGK